MKKWIVVFLPLMWGICVFAQEAAAPKAPVTAQNTPVQAKQQPAKVQPVFESEKAAKKAFTQRRKQINKLVKKYRKASAEEKPAIRKELYQIVSEGMDLGLSSMKARIAQRKDNLVRWEEKRSESEARWDE